MSANELARSEALFHRARALAANEREALLRAECAGDERLRALVEELLALDEAPHALDENPVASAQAPGDGETAQGRDELLPESVGRYRVLRRLGEGGMGTVYEAEQESPRRVVALKVLRAVLASPDMRARFRREAHVLGALAHPGIAQVYEAGTGALVLGGRAVAEVPFLALELVRGEPLTRGVARANLGLVARLELFARVCDALEHAHAQGIVHRDLKPANILVVEATTTVADVAPDSRLSPKVLDFGIARLVDDTGAGNSGSVATRTGEVLGTLSYMSPEQARGENALVDARTDVWALGVLLYELLTERRPFELDGLNLAQAAQRLADVDAPRLSRDDTRLRGDLETIVAKALEKEPSRRYAHAGELAADVRRHLAHVPIQARAASASYVIAKYARRHRALVVAATTGFCALVGGLGWGLLRERAQRIEAQSASRFLMDVLRAPNPLLGRTDMTLQGALDRFEPELAQRFADTPDLQVEMRRAFASSYAAITRLDRAIEQLERAVEVARAEHGPRARVTLATQSELAQLHAFAGDLGGGIALLERVHAAQREELGDADFDTRTTLLRIADASRQRGALDAAAQHYREFLALAESGHELEDEQRAQAELGLGELLVMQLRLDEAEEPLLAAARRYSERFGDDHPYSVGALHDVAVLRSRQGRFAEAREHAQRAFEASQRALGAEAQQTLDCLLTLAIAEAKAGDLARGIALLRDNAERCARALGPTHPSTLSARQSLGMALETSGALEESERALREASAGARDVLGPDGWETWTWQSHHADVLVRLERAQEALPLLEEAHRELERVVGPSDPRTQWAAGAAARACRALGRDDEAARWSAMQPSPQ